jgi:hypothetical protein
VFEQERGQLRRSAKSWAASDEKEVELRLPDVVRLWRQWIEIGRTLVRVRPGWPAPWTRTAASESPARCPLRQTDRHHRESQPKGRILPTNLNRDRKRLNPIPSRVCDIAVCDMSSDFVNVQKLESCTGRLPALKGRSAERKLSRASEAPRPSWLTDDNRYKSTLPRARHVRLLRGRSLEDRIIIRSGMRPALTIGC